MKNLKGLLLSIFVTLMTFGYLVVDSDCDLFGFREWRGDKASYYIIVVVTIVIVSLFTTIFQLFKFTGNSTGQFAQTVNPRVNNALMNAVWWFMAMLFVFLFVLHKLLSHTCH